MLYSLPMKEFDPAEFREIYAGFDAPIAALNCGNRCAPFNERGVPFCCDTRHAVPSAYQSEWIYLQENTDLWHPWQGHTLRETEEITAQAPDGQVLIACKGHLECQRDFRSLTCRAFPFFPYLTRAGDFIGLSCYWEYEDRCWVISNFEIVEQTYLEQFIATFDLIFGRIPGEREVFRYFSSRMRRVFGRRRRAIVVLHRNGHFYKISPHNGRMRRIPASRLPKFGVYQVVSDLPFPDEVEPS